MIVLGVKGDEDLKACKIWFLIVAIIIREINNAII